MNKELIILFFAMEHESDHLIEIFNKQQLLEFYVSGCELRLRMERSFENFNKFHIFRLLVGSSQLKKQLPIDVILVQL
jgi:hypothetical protein